MTLQLIERTLKEMIALSLADVSQDKIADFDHVEFLDIDNFVLDYQYRREFANEVITFSAPATAVVVKTFNGCKRIENVIYHGMIHNGVITVENIEANGRQNYICDYQDEWQQVEL